MAAAKILDVGELKITSSAVYAGSTAYSDAKHSQLSSRQCDSLRYNKQSYVRVRVSTTCSNAGKTHIVK